ncbi:hypothetical protein [Cohnella silvisoli]|uniref:Uncharacterized protein n=1 Tax=Cohnella silvisoli TaxID=2873699 RepID=A0ABV1L125_9BACL|nr:hypothetical protein [Cohnella silvisoli]MCD9025219.1 hypothetical protein [Cohnella silvisoli]
MTTTLANTLLVTWFIVAGQATQYAGQAASNAGAISVYIASFAAALALFLAKRVKLANTSSDIAA